MSSASLVFIRRNQPDFHLKLACKSLNLVNKTWLATISDFIFTCLGLVIKIIKLNICGTLSRQGTTNLVM